MGHRDELRLFSFAAAVAAGPSGLVLAGESDTTLSGLLRRSAAANHGHAPVDVLPAAVSDEETVARFHILRRSRSTNHLDGFGTTQTGGVRSTQLVPAVTLDWLADRLGSPGAMKIDVEETEAAWPTTAEYAGRPQIRASGRRRGRKPGLGR